MSIWNRALVLAERGAENEKNVAGGCLRVLNISITVFNPLLQYIHHLR